MGPVKPRSNDDVLEEILETTRALSSRVRRMEHDRVSLNSKFERISLPSLRREIGRMIISGMPGEAIMDRFKDEAPIGFTIYTMKEYEIKISNSKN